ncbi:MAG TPA: AIR synthase-related protein, partial [Anaerolineae bacterium]|nr:AIR synthase-related protein [Anaerolineae bacterium]
EMGGSHYWDINRHIGNSVPTVKVAMAKKTMMALHRAIDRRLVLSCHDCSEGGIGVALAEMAFAGEVGTTIDLTRVPVKTSMRMDNILFSESNSRFIVEVTEENVNEFSEILEGIPFAVVGQTNDLQRVIIQSSLGAVVDEDIFELKQTWQAPLKTL